VIYLYLDRLQKWLGLDGERVEREEADIRAAAAE
jgi:hypothetical protein